MERNCYSHDLAEAICLRIADGETLRKICQSDEMPNKATVFRWLAKRDDFRRMYAAAKDMMMDAFEEDILDIADDTSRDTITTKDGRQFPNKEWIEWARVRISTRQWLLCTLMPRKYGYRQVMEHSGAHKRESLYKSPLKSYCGIYNVCYRTIKRWKAAGFPLDDEQKTRQLIEAKQANMPASLLKGRARRLKPSRQNTINEDAYDNEQ